LLGNLLLWGIDDLLVYHYLVAEANRHLDLPPEKFRALRKSRQAAEQTRRRSLSQQQVPSLRIQGRHRVRLPKHQQQVRPAGVHRTNSSN
jgi:hypothetical protein